MYTSTIFHLFSYVCLCVTGRKQLSFVCWCEYIHPSIDNLTLIDWLGNEDKVLWPEPQRPLGFCCAFGSKSPHNSQPVAMLQGASHPLTLCHRSSAPPDGLIDRELSALTPHCMVILCWISFQYYMMHSDVVIPLFGDSFLLLYHTTVCSVRRIGGGGGGGCITAFCCGTTACCSCAEHQCKTKNMKHWGNYVYIYITRSVCICMDSKHMYIGS